MEVICLEDRALKALIDKVIAYVKTEHGIKEDKWLSTEEAMKKLRITSRTTLQKYRDEGEIKFSQLTPKSILYDRDSIEAYLTKKSQDNF